MKMIAFLRRLHFPLMLLSGIIPLVLMMISYACVIPSFGAWLFPCACMLMCALCLCLCGRVRLVPLALSLLSALFLSSGNPALRIMAIAAPWLCLAALPFAGRDAHSIPPFFYVIGIAAQLLTQFLLRIAADGGSQSVVSAPANALFVLYLILLLLALNRISTDNAALSRYRLPTSVRRVNTLLTLVFTAITLLLTFSSVIVQGIHAGLRALRTAILALGAWIISLLYTPEVSGGLVGAPNMPLALGAAPVQPPSKLAILMEYIATVLAAIVLIAGMLVLLRAAIRLLVRAFVRFAHHLHRFTLAAAEDYVDEITDTRNEEGERQSTLLRRRHAQAYPDTPQGAVRRQYARLLRRHPHWAAGSTARENLADDPASIYERARYSSHPVTREDADAFARTAPKLPEPSHTSDWRKSS